MKKDIVYCSLRKCPRVECLRHNVNAPWEMVFTRRKFNPDKNWNCKDKLTDDREGR